MKRFENKQAGLLSVSDLKTAKGKAVYWFMFACMVALGLVCIVPFIWALMTGFKSSQEIYSSFSFFPKDLTWPSAKQHISDAMNGLKFWKTTFNTVFMAAGEVVRGILVTGLGGYVISRLKPKGARLMFLLFTWSMMLPAQIRLVPQYISFLSFPFLGEVPGEISLMDTYWPMWLGAAANCFNIILFKNHFDSISDSFVDAAKLDGCGNGRIFFSIMIPMSGPILIYVTIMYIKGAFASFLTPYLVLSNNELYTLSVRLYQMVSAAGDVTMSTYMLALTIASLPTLLLFCIFQKYITGGVNLGGVKG